MNDEYMNCWTSKKNETDLHMFFYIIFFPLFVLEYISSSTINLFLYFLSYIILSLFCIILYFCCIEIVMQ